MSVRSFEPQRDCYTPFPEPPSWSWACGTFCSDLEGLIRIGVTDQHLQRAPRAAAVDCFPRHSKGLEEVPLFPRNHEGGRGVEDHDVARRPFLPVQDAADAI